MSEVLDVLFFIVWAGYYDPQIRGRSDIMERSSKEGDLVFFEQTFGTKARLLVQRTVIIKPTISHSRIERLLNSN